MSMAASYTRYRLLEPLGAGGMGVVYKAYDRLNGEYVALKQVQVAAERLHFTTTQDVTNFHLALAQEFHILAGLRHPNIIDVVDYGFDTSQQPFFTMELLTDHTPLNSYGEDRPLATQLDLLLQLLQALVYLNRRGIVHRDLKPKNVLVVQGKVKVLDFGLAVARDYLLGGNVAGTLAYIAPEVLRGARPDPLADLYAVGVIAYELFAGRLPFHEANPNELIFSILNQVPDVTALNVPAPLSALVARLLDKDPQQRYASAAEVLHELASIAEVTLAESSETRRSYLENAEFIGRATELRQLETALHDITRPNPQGSAWLIGGESGIGKSRLFNELRIRALLSGVLVLQGQCSEENRRGYEAWYSVLKRLILHAPPHDLEASVLQKIVPDLAILLEKSIDPAPELVGIDARELLLLTIQNLFRRQQQPILILLEDLHWAVESLLPLQRLLHTLTQEALPLMIVGSFRNDEAPHLPAELKTMHPLLLTRFDRQTVTDLTVALLGQEAVHQEFIEYLNQETEGIPFFIVETLRYLAEQGGDLTTLVHQARPQRLLAGGIQRVVQRRLATVAVTDLPALRLAAIAGRVLDLRLLAALCPDFDYDAWLNRCLDAALLSMTEQTVQFAHDKIRYGVLEGIPSTEWAALNRQVATGIEALYPDDPAYAVVLADYWHEAGAPDRELAHLAVAVREVLLSGLMTQADHLVQRALALPVQPAPIRVQLLIAQGTIGFRVGRLQESAEAYAQALVLARALEQPATEARALRGLGNSYYGLGRYAESETSFQAALQLYRHLHDLHGESDTLHDLSNLARFQGRYALAREYLQACLQVGRQAGHVFGVLRGLYQLSVMERNDEHYAAAAAAAQESADLARKLGYYNDLSNALNSLGLNLLLMGQYDAALAALLESLQLRQQGALERGMAATHSAIGDLYLAQQQYDIALDYYEQALVTWQRVQERWNISNSLADCGYPQFFLGELARADAAFREALQVGADLKAGFLQLKALIGLAWIAVTRGDVLHTQAILAAVVAHPAMTAPLRQLRLQPLVMHLTALGVAITPAADPAQALHELAAQYLA
jgi:serine/threonine protein kinase